MITKKIFRIAAVRSSIETGHASYRCRTRQHGRQNKGCDDHRLLRDLENSGHFDFIFHGHTHQAADRRVGKTRIINPGALHRARPKTFVVLDLASATVESIAVE